jgi:predicted SAM-dependent methyltransferase
VTSQAGGPSYGVRQLFGRHLIGTGLELGALHHPYAVPLPAIETRYVDRWTPDEARALFPELGEVDFTAADHIADLNVDRLSMIEDESQDFVVASHVLEHVANPLALLVDMHRVLRPGGTVLIMLPDRRRTSDFRRPATTVEHLVAEYEHDVRAVDADHLEEYARNVNHYEGQGEELREYLAHLAQRSIHVHAWSEEDFFAVLHHAVGHLGCRFELVELLQTEEFTKNIEYGYVLRRTTADVPDEALARRLLEQKRLMVEHRAARGWIGPEAQLKVRDLEAAVRAGRRRIARLERRIEHYEAWIGPLRRSPLWPVLRLAERVRRRAVTTAPGAPARRTVHPTRAALRPREIPSPRESTELEPVGPDAQYRVGRADGADHGRGS